MYEFCTDAALIATSCVYAEWLADHKQLEPDWTWIEVGVGVSYCLLHAYLRAKHDGGDWRSGWYHAARSLLIGGIPVACGEVAQAARRRQKRRAFAARWG